MNVFVLVTLPMSGAKKSFHNVLRTETARLLTLLVVVTNETIRGNVVLARFVVDLKTTLSRHLQASVLATVVMSG